MNTTTTIEEANADLLQKREQVSQPPKPHQLGEGIQAVLERLRTRVIQVTPEMEQQMSQEREEEKEMKSLEQSGYPLRQREKLKEMTGPSLDTAQKLLPRVLAGDVLLILIGDRGPGKTQMATFWAWQLLREGKNCGYYRKTADLIGEIKATWSNAKKSEEDVLQKYRRCRYLVLDEWSEKGSSEWESRVLVNILDHRYDNKLSTIIIANMDRQQARAELPPSILSRAEETGGLVRCEWPSYRQKAAGAA